VLGALAGRLAAAGARILARHGLEHRSARLGLAVWVLGIPFAIYVGAELVHGYGLVAVFTAGFALRRGEQDERLHIRIAEISEPAGHATELLAVVLLGALLTTRGLAVPGLGGWLVAPVVLLLVRPLIVLVLATRTPLGTGERLYLGFFGVRGVAAVYYAAVLAGSGVLPRHATAVVVWTTLVCVAVSIVLHGVSARPLSRRWLGERS
jgi:NhaP-type Na+/H+ or K+/H+ antiporter